MNSAGGPHLALELGDGAFEYTDQRTGAKLFGDRGDVLHALRLAEGADEPSALGARSPDEPPLGENHSPGKHAEDDEDEDNDFGDRTGLKDEINDFAADKQQEDGRKMHRFRGNPS